MLHNPSELLKFSAIIGDYVRPTKDRVFHGVQSAITLNHPLLLVAFARSINIEWHREVATAGGADTYWAIPVLAPLAAFRSEFEYLIRDTEVEARSTTELAFEHLKRQIAVDEDVKKKWKKAFARHETDCEKLGASVEQLIRKNSRLVDTDK